MIILGIILILAGAASYLYGNALNRDIEAQLTALFSTGSLNSGNPFIYAGIAIFVIGLLIMIIGIVRKQKK